MSTQDTADVFSIANTPQDISYAGTSDHLHMLFVSRVARTKSKNDIKGNSVPKEQNVSLPIDLNSLPPEEVAEAIAEAVIVEKILREARSRAPGPMVTERSIREGERFMAKMRRASEEALLSRIERGALITRDELVTRLGGNRRWVNNALKAGRLFSLQAPSGDDYFPSFFADSSYDRRALGRVAKALTGLPGQSRYHFFMSKSLTLGMTPLEALAEGRVEAVIMAAVGFAVR